MPCPKLNPYHIMQQATIIQNNDVLQAVRYAVDRYKRLITDHGTVTGEDFAKEIERATDPLDPIACESAQVARKHLVQIRISANGGIRCEIKIS